MMGKIKNPQQKSYIRKGYIAGALFGLLLAVIQIIGGAINSKALISFSGFLMVPSTFISFLLFGWCSNNLGICFPLLLISIFVMAPIIYAIFGGIIGYIIYRAKSRGKED